MKVRTLCPLAAALGIWAAGPAGAKDKPKPPPAPAAAKAPAKPATPADNQTLAEAVGARLTATASADGADVTIVTEGGTVTVTGRCRDAVQRQAILQDIRVVPGVKMVRDGITTGTAAAAKPGPVTQAQAALPVGPVTTPAPVGVPPTAGGPVVEPAPLGGPVGGPADGFAPPLPPYAWPTYAPYNNVSRVAYPQSYPYNAFPFIGPFYPFPKVPLGWRSVTLEFEDGHWFLGRTSAPQDYWRVRFW